MSEKTDWHINCYVFVLESCLYFCSVCFICLPTSWNHFLPCDKSVYDWELCWTVQHPLQPVYLTLKYMFKFWTSLAFYAVFSSCIEIISKSADEENYWYNRKDPIKVDISFSWWVCLIKNRITQSKLFWTLK